MKKYTDINDISNLSETIQKAIQLKENPFGFSEMAKNKTLVMLFFNSSLRTRLSTEKAAKNLGMQVMVLNVSDTWNLEFEDGKVMNLNTSEHIKEAAEVISQYADIIAVRAFPSLKDKQKDDKEIKEKELELKEGNLKLQMSELVLATGMQRKVKQP